jgi:tetratricopeptide (TPR) repeat protein
MLKSGLGAVPAKLIAALAIAGLSLTTPAWAAGRANPFDPPKTVQSLPDINPEGAMLADALKGIHAQITATGDPDADATLAAVADVDANGILSIGGHEAQLRKVLADMPQPYSRNGFAGGEPFYRADNMAECLAHVAQMGKGKSGSTKISCKGNPFASAAFYLGSYLDEIGRPQDALAVLDQGLVSAPDAPRLIAERSAALVGMNRNADILANADHGLSIANLADEDRARFYRNRGYALTELGRLDEAEQAYHDCLKLVPDNAMAKNELIYIGRLRAGAAPIPGGIKPLTGPAAGNP